MMNLAEMEQIAKEIMAEYKFLRKGYASHVYDINLDYFYLPYTDLAIAYIDSSTNRPVLKVRMAYRIQKEKCELAMEAVNELNFYADKQNVGYQSYVGYLEKEPYLVLSAANTLECERDVHYLLNPLEYFVEILKPHLQEIIVWEMENKEKSPLVDIHDFMVISERKACLHAEHGIENLIVTVNCLTTKGDYMQIEVPASYCEQCELYFIRKQDYEELLKKSKGCTILCEIKTEDYYYNHPDFHQQELQPQSIMAKYGYNVSQKENLSAKERQAILTMLVERKIMTRDRIMSYLKYFIDLRRTRDNYRTAVAKWQEDWGFIKEYKTESNRVVAPAKITVIKYHEK